MSYLRTYPIPKRVLTISSNKLNAKETLIVALGEPVDARQNLWLEQKVSCAVTPKIILAFIEDCLKVFGEIDTLLLDQYHDADGIIQFAQAHAFKAVDINSFPGFKDKIERYLHQRNTKVTQSWRNAFPEILSDNPRKTIPRGYINTDYLNQFYSEREGDQL